MVRVEKDGKTAHLMVKDENVRTFLGVFVPRTFLSISLDLQSLLSANSFLLIDPLKHAQTP